MPTQAIEARVHYAPGSPDTPIIDLQGDIDASAQDALNTSYAEATRHAPSALLLNLQSVGYINSSGIALIVSLLIQARKAGCRLLVCGLNEHYLRVFHITGLADFMSIFPDEPSALAEAPTRT